MEKTHLVNREIRSNRIMLLDNEGNKLGEVSFNEAFSQAQKENLDLMQVGENQGVSICKILNYESWLYHEKKRKDRQDFKNRGQEVKTINFSPAIGVNDFNLKVKKVNEFLSENHKVKILVKFKNYRETTMHDINKNFIDKIISNISEFGDMDGKVNFGGKDMNFILKPSKKPSQKPKP